MNLSPAGLTSGHCRWRATALGSAPGNRSHSCKRSSTRGTGQPLPDEVILDAGEVARCVNEIGVGFLFAPKHHGAMKYTIGPRREMGVRTLFNLLGPLANPAGAPNQLIGVFAKEWLEPLAEVLAPIMGLIDRIPKIGIVQADGCAPMVQAWKNGEFEQSGNKRKDDDE